MTTRARLVEVADRQFSVEAVARDLARRIAAASRPRSPLVQLVDGGTSQRLFVVNGSRLYDLDDETAEEVRLAMDRADDGPLVDLLARLGLDAPLAIDDRPLENPSIHALSLAVAQKCNLGCTYCYAQQGEFGGPPRNMPEEVAFQAVGLLIDGAVPGGNVNLAFLGGEPLINREVLRSATRRAARLAAEKNVTLRCSITTNGTLLTDDDAEFFEEHGFAVTISLDGKQEDHDLLRPFKGGAGSFDRIVKRIEPLLRQQRRMQVSARVTVTPQNMDLLGTLDEFLGMGFHSVGFSPLLRSVDGRGEMDSDDLARMLEGMIACGLSFEQNVLARKRYPFLNMVNSLRELHRGTHRPYPCGAGAGYLGVSATGDLAACHRFVDDQEGAMGNLDAGVDRARQSQWLAMRHVDFQEPCRGCWARYLCGGGCHHEVLARGRSACDFIRGWLHYTIQAHGRLLQLAPEWFEDSTSTKFRDFVGEPRPILDKASDDVES
jgi:uncharacterized protein